MADAGPGLKGALGRIGVALLLVVATFNPSGTSFYHWAIAPLFARPVPPGFPHPGMVVLGILLVIGWIFAVQATRRSIGPLGAVLTVALCAALVWLLARWSVVSVSSSSAVIWIALIVTGLLLGVGMTWSHISRGVTGQVDTDEVN
jgi:hypothetical protein